MIILSIMVAFSATSMAATKLVYDRIYTRVAPEVTAVPEELQPMVRGRQPLSYPSGENQLTGYLYRTQEGQDALVILVPGYHAGADSYLWQIKGLLDRGWSVLAFDPTGWGASQGDSLVGFSQVLVDLEQTLKYVEKSGYFGYTNIMLLGHSQGGYAACCALEYDKRICAAVSVSGVNSPMEGVMGATAAYTGPLAYGNYGFLWAYQALLFGPKRVNLRADRQIARASVPVLVIHGEQDTQVPAERYSILSHREQIPQGRAEYLVCGQGHTDLLFDETGRENRELMDSIHRFLLNSLD